LEAAIKDAELSGVSGGEKRDRFNAVRYQRTFRKFSNHVLDAANFWPHPDEQRQQPTVCLSLTSLWLPKGARAAAGRKITCRGTVLSASL